MPFAIGVLLALAVGMMATATRLDRDRAFYPTVMIVIAMLYSLFAVMGGSTHALMIEILFGSLFVGAALWGFASSLWIVAAALALHGIQDFAHGRFISNPGVPAWWPAFCGAYDVAAAIYLGWLLKSGRIQTAAAR